MPGPKETPLKRADIVSGKWYYAKVEGSWVDVLVAEPSPAPHRTFVCWALLHRSCTLSARQIVSERPKNYRDLALEHFLAVGPDTHFDD